jgi:hypothetical protein
MEIKQHAAPPRQQRAGRSLRSPSGDCKACEATLGARFLSLAPTADRSHNYRADKYNDCSAHLSNSQKLRENTTHDDLGATGKAMSVVNMKGNEMMTKIKFDDFGMNNYLAIVDESGNYEWVEPQITSIPSESCIRVQLIASNGEGDEDARQSLREYISEHYQVEIPCDFRDSTNFECAVTKATAIRDRFLFGNRVPFSSAI